MSAQHVRAPSDSEWPLEAQETNRTWATGYVKERLEGMGLCRIQGSDFRAIANFVSPNQ